MPENAPDPLSPQSGKSPLKVMLLVAVVLVVAGLAYLAVSQLSSGLDKTEEETGLVEGMIEEANPFPETEAFNLPPHDEMVDDSGAPPNTINPAPAEGADGLPASEAAVVIDVDQAMGPRAIGDANAPIKITEYFSLTCHHCANFHTITLPEIRQYIDSGEVYLEFREFPLNAPALRASMIARCLPEDRYYGYISLLFKTLDTWTTNPDYMSALRQNAKLAGMSDERFDACLASNQLQQALGTQMKAATEKWQIESTPTFIVNGGEEIIKGAQPAYEFERVFRAVSGGKIAPLENNTEQEATE